MRNYLFEMLDALTSAYSHKDHDNLRLGDPVETNIGKLFSILAWGLNMVHEQADLIKLWDHLDNARGSVLDRYGANFGVQRQGANDAFYRLAIRVKVLSQLSGGDTETVINAAADLLDVKLTDVLLEDVFPAKIALFVDQDLLSEERLEMIEPIAWAIKRILAAGVGMRLYMRTYRTYRYDLPVGHAGAIGTFARYHPIGEDREIIWDVPVARGGSVVTDFVYEPIGKDRSARTEYGVGHAGLARPVFSGPPVSSDKLYRRDVSVARGGLLPPALTGAFPDTARADTDRRGARGGAYMRSHIKPRRIE